MTDNSDKLPELKGELSRKDILRHLVAGNVVGYVVAYGTFDRYEFEQFEGAGALGKAVIARCVEINDDIPETEMDLGTDLTFYTADDDTSEEDFELEEDDDPDFAPSLLLLSVDDANHLLAHMPEQFLNQSTSKGEPF